MTHKQILDLFDVKKQNLPKISLDSTDKKYPLIVIPVFEEDKSKLKKGETNDTIQRNQLIRKVGVGRKKDFDARAVRRFFGSVYNSAASGKPKAIAIHCWPEWVKWAAVGIHVAALDPGMLKPGYKKTSLTPVALVNSSFTKTAVPKKELKAGITLAEGKNLMRILGGLPPNDLNPQSYAKLVQDLCKSWGISCKRIPKAELKNYKLLNAVSLGSGYQSELLVITVNPKNKKHKTAQAVIGKGLCFDSGGVQDKQNYMKFMKEDMAGSAAVLGAAHQAAKGNLNVKETTYFVLPLAENMMGTNAMRADDIWQTGDGQTVEIVHTDAEGRLVLADAICFMKKNYKNVESYFTIATLTGSCLRAFGDVYTGMVCNDDSLVKKAMKAGEDSGDYVWPAPWNREFDEMLKSPVADVPNLTEEPNAGWITAGMFLHRFIPRDKNGDPQAKFCHFDIAGAIDMNEKGKSWRKKGFNSGVGVSLFTELLAG